MSLAEICLFGPFKGSDGHYLLWTSRDRIAKVRVPQEPAHDLAHARLRERLEHRDVADAIGAEGSRALQELLSSCPKPTRIRLALREGGAEFERLNQAGWEWLGLAGQPLGSSGVIERYASINWEASPCVHGEVVVLDTWFDRKGEPARCLSGLDELDASVIKGLENVRPYLATGAFAGASAGVVVAHGNPVDGACDSEPFLAGEEPSIPWGLGNKRLPPVLLLLVCGDDHGTYVSRLARACLARGARCVIAPNGTLNRTQADRFLQSFVAEWKGPRTVAEILCAAQSQSTIPGGAQCLWLVGDGDITRVDSPSDCRSSPRDRYEQCRQALDSLDKSSDSLARFPLDSPTLADLLHTLCLMSLQDTGSPDAAAERVIKLVPEIWLGEKRVRELGRALHDASRYCAVVERGWVARIVSFLEEAYGQGLLRPNVLQAQAPELDVPQPRLRFYQSRGLYRLGAYEKCTPTVLRALKECGDLPDLKVVRHDLLGDLAGYLIDLNLGAEALTICTSLRDRLDPVERDDARKLFELRDRIARANVRCGDLNAALNGQLLKRSEAPAWTHDGHRELAWLLFLAAWAGDARPSAAVAWAEEARREIESRLFAQGSTPIEFRTGDDSLPYMIRSAAAWTWLSGDRRFENLAPAIIDTLQSNALNSNTDPGPIGIAAACLKLAGFDRAGVVWEQAALRMTEWKYYLELTVLQRLLGETRAAQQSLDRFQRLRRKAVTLPSDCSWPDEMGDGTIDEARWSALESAELSALANATPFSLTPAGLIPI